MTQMNDDDPHAIEAMKAAARATKIELPILKVRWRDADGIGAIGLQHIADRERAAVIVAAGTKYHSGKIFFPLASKARS